MDEIKRKPEEIGRNWIRLVKEVLVLSDFVISKTHSWLYEVGQGIPEKLFRLEKHLSAAHFNAMHGRFIYPLL